MGVFELQTKEANFKDETNKGQQIKYLRVKKAKKVVKCTHLKNSPTDTYSQQEYQCESQIKCERLIKYFFTFRLSHLSISRLSSHRKPCTAAPVKS